MSMNNELRSLAKLREAREKKKKQRSEKVEHSDVDEDHPGEFVCPITQDLMCKPMKILHLGKTYHFDEAAVKTWWKTEGGDKNPLTMMEGFRNIKMEHDLELDKKIKEYKVSIGRDRDEEIQEVELEPYSDYDQIQADEQEALRLHRELNDEVVDIGNSGLFRLLRERNPRILLGNIEHNQNSSSFQIDNIIDDVEEDIIQNNEERNILDLLNVMLNRYTSTINV
tara:strand:- start:1372 stop:2046 length:675 start_codon:yes stop_codon:yes gene_type:complete